MADADARLVLRCQSNDLAAFNDIVARYQHRVYGYVCRMVGHTPEAEDLTQETFVKAYQGIRTFQSRASLNTWLYRIATNLCIDYARRAARTRGMTESLSAERPGEEHEGDLELPDVRFDPLTITLNHELQAHLNEAIEGLPQRLRAVLLLHDIEGLAYDEIASAVGCPLGTVKSRLFHARMAVRGRLAPYIAAIPSPAHAGLAVTR
ncbi:MAG TPA: sigma-70 family RNA polymerase sigma factor [Chthonomonadales bacterium]|nr:sigma-70 family RNA polymerase sigma factor [Chthonomonadales bacterium]